MKIFANKSPATNIQPIIARNFSLSAPAGRGEGRGEVRANVVDGRFMTVSPLTLTLSPLRGEGTSVVYHLIFQ
jgi:hypothetical protein